MDVNQTRYIGSFLKWTQEGIEQYKQVLADHFDNKDDVPFIGYDAVQHAFYLRSNDSSTVQHALTTFNALVRIKQQKSKSIDILSDDPFNPIECTLLPSFEDYVPATTSAFSQNDLIVIEDDSDEESSSNTSSGGVPSVYWTPENGDISILPDSLAKDLATISECMLYKEADHGRVRLMNGNTVHALQKLKQLEYLMVLMAQNRQQHSTIVHENLLFFSSQLPGVGVVHASVTTESPGRRILVHTEVEPQLEDLFVGEEYVYDEVERKPLKAKNLMDSNTMTSILARSSKRFDDNPVPNYGDPESVKPQKRVKSSLSETTRPSDSSVSSRSETTPKFMAPTEQAKVREWQRMIDTEADPAAQPEHVEELANEDDKPVTRRIVEASDDDVEVGESVHTVRQIASESSDEDVVMRDTTYKSRQLAPDSSDEDDATARKPTAQSRLALMAHGQPQTRQRARFNADNLAATGNQANTHPHKSLPARSRGDQQAFSSVGVKESDDLYGGDPGSRSDHTTLQNSQKRSARLTSMRNDDQDQDLVLINARQTQSSKLDAAKPSIPNEQSFPALSVRSHQQQGKGFNSSNLNTNNQQKPRTYASQTSSFSQQQNNRLVQSLPRPSNHIANRQGRNARAERDGDIPGQNILVDIRSDDYGPPSPANPPPGFDIRPKRQANDLDVHLLDGPLDQIQRASLKPARDPAYSEIFEDASYSISSTSDPSRRQWPGYTSRPEIIRPNANHMADGMLQLLQAANSARKPPPKSLDQHQRERIESDDEMSSRKYLRSMNLQAPNPGKGKTGKGGPKPTSMKETAAEKAERVAKQMAELGVPRGPVSTRPPPKSTSHTVPEKPSSRLQKAAKTNDYMASTQTDMKRNAAIDKLVKELHPLLSKALDPASKFPGKLRLRFYFGQLLIEKTARMKPNRMMEAERWQKTFIESSDKPQVSFTKRLTNDGSDIDSILEMNSREKKAKIWDKNNVIENILEFRCLDNSGSDFNLIFNLDGSHYITGPVENISRIGLHCPGSVWDICAELGGHMPWQHPPEHLDTPIKDLLSSICVQADPVFTVFFRLPTGNVLSVRDVILHRTTIHQCQDTDFQGVHLRITEWTHLHTKSHRHDKRLHSCMFKSHDVMVRENRLHYEMSLHDKALDKAFVQRQTLGSTDHSDDLQSSLDVEKCQQLVEKALQVVDKLDWVGKKNYGTLRRLQDEKNNRDRELARSAPPTLRSNLIRPVLDPGHSIAGPRTFVGSRTTEVFDAHGSIAQPIHGIRAGTYAQLYEDADGNRFRLGQGASVIPIAEEEVIEVVPDDSASQSGRRPGRRPAASHENKGHDFW